MTHQKFVSPHRAFVYGAIAPGTGEFYAGSRLRGVITASLFIILTAWFMLTLFTVLQAVVDRIFDGLNGMESIALPDLPFVYLGISFLGIYYLWLWALIAAVDAAVSHRQTVAGPPRASVAWAVSMSWFCPGSGQLLQGRDTIGWYLLAGYLGSKLLIGFLLGMDLITVSTTDGLAWVPLIIQWAAMLEAPIRMMIGKEKRSP